VNHIAALGILSSLEPKASLQIKPRADDLHEYHVLSDISIKEKEKKKPFGVWSARDKGKEHTQRDRERDRERPREKESYDSDIPEITAMIGEDFLLNKTTSAIATPNAHFLFTTIWLRANILRRILFKEWCRGLGLCT
jgi:hypothetical protein